MKAVGWLFLALLLLLALGLSFLIHPLLGFFMALLMGGAFGWAAYRKRRVDAVLAEVARQAGLQVERRWPAYNTLRGTFQGFETRVRIRTASDAGVGTQLTVLTGDAGWSALDTRAVTTIRMKHGLPLQQRTRLSKHIMATPTEAILTLPYVPQNPDEILAGLQELAHQINRHARARRSMA